MNKQQRGQLTSEMDRIMEHLTLNYRNGSIFTKEENFIEAKETIIRWYIVLSHSYIDYMMTCFINHKLFKKKQSIELLIKNNKLIKAFNHKILEYISFRRKLEILREIKTIDKQINNKLERIDSIRNKLAHLWSFEIDSKQKGNNIVEYSGNNIMDINWLALFVKEANEVIVYLEKL